jgi:transglutaminase-like putative cysteine protease
VRLSSFAVTPGTRFFHYGGAGARAVLGLALVALAGAASAQATVKITSLYPVNYQGKAATPEVGDPWYGVGVNFTITGTPTSDYTVTFKYANQVQTWTNEQLSPGNYYWWASFYGSPAGPIPCSVTVANTDDSATSSANLPVAYPPHAIEFMDAKTMVSAQTVVLSFQKAGVVDELAMLFGQPQVTSSQSAATDYVPPSGSTLVTSQPLGITARQIVWDNINTSEHSSAGGEYSFSAVNHDSRVNPTIMETIPWSALAAALPSTVTMWQKSETICPTSAAEVSDIVSKALPSNYLSTNSPWTAAQSIFLQVAKSLTYNANIPTEPLHAYDIGEGCCGDYAYLLVAALRKIGFAARICAGWETGSNDSHIWSEFYMPGVGWVPADATYSCSYDPTGTYAYFFGTVPGLNGRTAVSLGGQQNWPYANFNVSFLQWPAWWWSGDAVYSSSAINETLVIPAAMEVEPSTPLMPQNSVMYGTIELKSPAPTGGMVVTLKSGSTAVEVPSTVTIYAGGTTATFPIVAGAVSADTPVEILATGGTLSASAQVTVKVQTVRVALSPKFLTPGNPTVTVTLSETPSAATVVSTSSNVSGWLPSSITIPAGVTSATFTGPLPVNAAITQLTVTATLPNQSDTDTLLAAPRRLGIFTSAASVTGGSPVTLTIRLASAAPTGGTVVSLVNSLTGFTLSSSSITIPAGATSATVTLTTPAVTAAKTDIVTATSTLGAAQVSVTALP